MRAYSAALFMIVFGAILGMINAIALTPDTVPEHNVGLGKAEVQELTEGATSSDVSALQPYEIATSVGGVLLSGLVMALTIVPLLLSLGVPADIAILLNAPIWFVYGWGMLQLMTGRATKTMD